MSLALQSDAFEFSEALRGLTHARAYTDLFAQAIAAFGFDSFACGELDLQDSERNVFYLMNWPDDWRKFYAESGLIERDPVIDMLRSRREPFSWSDLRANGTISRVGREGLDLCAARGWVEGLVVPVSRTRNKAGLVSMVGRREISGRDELGFLCIISTFLHQHARSHLSQNGFAIPPMGLTAREMDCLRLVGAGKSDRAIATKLGIAVGTAHEYVENAKRKLKARSRAETIAVAVSLGIIDP